MQYIKQIMLLVILTISWKCQAEEVKEIWLDELGESSYYIQDWGLPRINKAVTMTPLTVKGIVYERGIGTMQSAVCSLISEKKPRRFPD